MAHEHLPPNVPPKKKNMEEKLYTTGQMIDLLLRDEDEELEAETSENLSPVRMRNGQLFWYDGTLKEPAHTIVSNFYANSKWIVRKRDSDPKFDFVDALEAYKQGMTIKYTYKHAYRQFNKKDCPLNIEFLTRNEIEGKWIIKD